MGKVLAAVLVVVAGFFAYTWFFGADPAPAPEPVPVVVPEPTPAAATESDILDEVAEELDELPGEMPADDLEEPAEAGADEPGR